MAEVTAAAEPRIELGIAGRALGGAAQSGDLHIMVPHAGGVTVGLCDGIGHGAEAAEASLIAAETCLQNAGRPVAELILCCHEALRHSRGAVLSLACIDFAAGTVEWAGIGNVEAVLHRRSSHARRESLSLRGGVVGYQIPKPHVEVLPLSAGDVLVFASDGVAGNFMSVPPGELSAQELSDYLLDHHGKMTDDALVAVVRYVGIAS